MPQAAPACDTSIGAVQNSTQATFATLPPVDPLVAISDTLRYGRWREPGRREEAISDIARALHQEENLISRLSHEQEQEIVSNPKLFLVAVCALNHVGFDQIVATYDISRPECIQLLARLDRLGFIRLLPNNRIRLLISLDFAWLPDGPIQRFFNQQAHNEYFRSRFDRPDEFMVVVNGMLSRASSAALVTRLKRIAREFSELNNQDARLPLGERSAMSLLVAIRHWELAAFAELRRRKTVNPTGARS